MKKYLPTSGFTLIELLVVIAIIAVLAVIGFAAFQGLTGRGNDSRRRADVKAIADVYEVKRTAAMADYGGEALAATDFAGGAIPIDPTTGRQYCFKASTSAVPNAGVPADITAAGVCAGTWTAVSTAAIAASQTFWKVCTLLSDNTTVVCSGSKQ